MKRVASIVTAIVVCFGALQAAPDQSSDKPQYTSDNKLLPPKNFREWIFLSSGLGMSYSPQGADHQMFTNVFVPHWAYSEFLKNGKWPDQTMFVVEERSSQTKGSINKAGPQNQPRPIPRPLASNAMKIMRRLSTASLSSIRR